MAVVAIRFFPENKSPVTWNLYSQFCSLSWILLEKNVDSAFVKACIELQNRKRTVGSEMTALRVSIKFPFSKIFWFKGKNEHKGQPGSSPWTKLGISQEHTPRSWSETQFFAAANGTCSGFGRPCPEANFNVTRTSAKFCVAKNSDLKVRSYLPILCFSICPILQLKRGSFFRNRNKRYFPTRQDATPHPQSPGLRVLLAFFHTPQEMCHTLTFEAQRTTFVRCFVRFYANALPWAEQSF